MAIPEASDDESSGALKVGNSTWNLAAVAARSGMSVLTTKAPGVYSAHFHPDSWHRFLLAFRHGNHRFAGIVPLLPEEDSG
jgi:hypothetical protein